MESGHHDSAHTTVQPAQPGIAAAKDLHPNTHAGARAHQSAPPLVCVSDVRPGDRWPGSRTAGVGESLWRGKEGGNCSPPGIVRRFLESGTGGPKGESPDMPRQDRPDEKLPGTGANGS